MSLSHVYPNMAALNPEPADPQDRQAHHLAPKSYADAAEEGLNGHSHFNEDDIKETPPRSRVRQGSEPRSEPRPLGEILTESEERVNQLATPSRVSRKPVASKSYADAAIEHPPNGAHLKHDLDGIHDLDGRGEQYTGEGMAESPRSPTRKPHRRVSSKSMNGTTSRDVSDGLQPKLVQEKFEGKDGDTLTSVKPPNGYEENLKLDKKERPQKHKRAPSENLVSGRKAGAGWEKSAYVHGMDQLLVANSYVQDTMGASQCTCPASTTDPNDPGTYP